MKDRKIIMGIDTSNYTTSVALMYSDGELIANIKEPLPVKLGECGLRQSDAVFAHIKNLPKAMEKASGILNGRSVSAIGVSERPRNVFGSYMPCFLAGLSAATSAAAASGVPLYRFSHRVCRYTGFRISADILWRQYILQMRIRFLKVPF